MANKMAPGSPDDGITAAINEVARTMGGETGDFHQPADRLNTEVEDRLLEEGAFVRRGGAQRQVLGCIACRLNDPEVGEIRTADIARCHDKAPGHISSILSRLRDTGILQATQATREEHPGKRGVLPYIYTLTGQAVQSGIAQSLQTPGYCGLKEGPRRPNATAEDMLIEAGVVQNKSDNARAAALGCMACQLRAGEPGIYSTGVEVCTSIGYSSVIRALRPLVEGGVVQTTTKARVPGGRPRVYYYPAATELGQDLKEVLEVPEQCGLEEKTRQGATE